VGIEHRVSWFIRFNSVNFSGFDPVDLIRALDTSVVGDEGEKKNPIPRDSENGA
jgi:hypothetical protein